MSSTDQAGFDERHQRDIEAHKALIERERLAALRVFKVAVTRIVKKEYVLTVTTENPLEVRQQVRYQLDNPGTRPTAVSADIEMVIHHIVEDTDA